MKLTPEAADFMAMLAEATPPLGRDGFDAPRIRRTVEEAPAVVYERAAVARVEDRELPGAAGPRPARIYSPRIEPGEKVPIVMLIHGGGWVMSTLETHDEMCRNLCNMAHAVVVSVHHRYADEAPVPAPLEDCYSMVTWVSEAAESLGADPARLAIAGDSSGGNLAAGLALLCRDRGGPRIKLQLLIYPALDNDFTTGSYREFGEESFITTDDMRWFWSQYVGDADAPLDPYAAPLRSTDLDGLPSARIITAECDPLRDEGEAYARMLGDAGVEVSLKRYPEMFHGFFSFPQFFGGSLTANQAEFALLRDSLRG